MLCLAGNENRAISTTYEIQPSKSGLLDKAGAETPLETKPSGIIVREGEEVRVETPGAGGFGSPS